MLLPTLLGFFTVAAHAQTAGAGTTAVQPALPSKPVELLELASRVNGLHGDDLKPWHVRAAWQTLDQNGKSLTQGTFEEWWAGKDEIRMVLNGPGFQQVRWATAEGDFTMGNRGWPSWVYTVVADDIESPLPDEKDLEDGDIKSGSEKIRAVRFQCAKDAPDRRDRQAATEYCFSNGLPALRVEITPATEAIFNDVLQFQGRYLARDISIVRLDMPEIAIHLDRIEPLDTVKPADFMPPAEATAAGAWEHKPDGKVTRGDRVSGKMPEYPEEAKRRRIQGTVMLSAVVGEDGSIHGVEVIGGPAALQQSALDAVKAWQYKPYLFKGKPIETSTEINVTYAVNQ